MATPVWLFVPNLIGYARIILAALAFWYYTNPELFFICYALSAILDMADGYAARYLDQCSKFGAVLDMITDRASTTCLTGILCHFYPQYITIWLFLMANDCMSHYAHMYSSLASGSSSHKLMKPEVHWLLKIYYTNRLVLAFLCGGNEGFFLFSYILYFYQGPLIIGIPLFKLALYVMIPIMAVKQSINVIQLRQAAVDIIKLDNIERVGKKD